MLPAGVRRSSNIAGVVAQPQVCVLAPATCSAVIYLGHRRARYTVRGFVKTSLFNGTGVASFPGAYSQTNGFAVGRASGHPAEAVFEPPKHGKTRLAYSERRNVRLMEKANNQFY